jgi:hypothetical protein
MCAKKTLNLEYESKLQFLTIFNKILIQIHAKPITSRVKISANLVP